MLDPNQYNVGQVAPYNIPTAMEQEVPQDRPAPASAPIKEIEYKPMAAEEPVPTPTPMMDVNCSDILNLYRDNNDLRRDLQAAAADIRYDGAAAVAGVNTNIAASAGNTRYDIADKACEINGHTSAVGWTVGARLEDASTRIADQGTQYFIAAQQQRYAEAIELAAFRAETEKSFDMVNDNIASATKIAALETQKVVIDDGQVTRGLINQLKNDELNRLLIERNTDLTCCRNDYHRANDGIANAQYAAIVSQLNAFQSSLSETRQGMINFGTMSGNSQAATTSQVR